MEDVRLPAGIRAIQATMRAERNVLAAHGEVIRQRIYLHRHWVQYAEVQSPTNGRTEK